MIRHRTVEEVKRYDIFKLLVIFILITILFFVFYGFIDRSPAEAITEPDQAAETQPTAESSETSPTETGGEASETTGTALAETGAETPATEEPAAIETETVESSTGADDTDTAELPTAEAVSTELAIPTLNAPEADLAAGPITLSGAGAPRSEVEIVVNGESLGKTTVGGDGSWAFEANLDKPGDYEVVVNGLDADGKVFASTKAATLSLTAPSTEGVAPTIDLPEGELPAGKVTFSGAGAPGSEVEIVVNGESLGKTTVGDDGSWTFEATLDEPGDYEVVVNDLDTDGNVFASTEAAALSLTAPDVEVVTPTIDLPEGELPAGKVTFSGTGAPGSEVEIVVDGESLGTTTVGDDGSWTFEAALDKPGDHEVVVNGLTADGKVGAASAPLTMALVVPEDATPEITLPTLKLPTGNLSAGEVALTGTGAPGSEVEIMADGESLGTATVGADGTWRFNSPFDKSGQVELVVNALDNQGRIITSTNSTLYSIAAPAEETAEPEVEITAPTVTSPQAGTALTPGRLALQGTGAPGSQIEIMIDGTSVGTATVRSTGRWTFATTVDEPGDYELVINGMDEDGKVVASATPLTLSLAEPEDTATAAALPTLDKPAKDITAGEVTLTGTGEPGSEVEIVIDGQSLGTATVDEDGTWRFTGTIDEPGDVEIVVNALDAKGQIITSTNPTLYTIADPQTESTAPTLASPLTGATLLAGRQTFRGTGEPGSEVEVVVNGEVIGTTTVRSNGTWSLSVEIDKPGQMDVTVNALDKAGAVAASSKPVMITLAESEESTASTGTGVETVDSPSATDETGLVCEEEYVVVADDWLSKLADKYFGDLFLYPAIVTATSQKNQVDTSFAAIDNPDLIEPGWKLCIVSTEAARELVAAGN